ESFPSPAPDLRREVLEAALEAAHRARAHGDPRYTPTSAEGAAARAAGSDRAPGRGARRRAPPPVAPRGARGRRGRPAPRRAATRAGRDRRRLPPGGAPSARRASPRIAAWSDRRAGAIRPRPRRTPRARADRG